MKHKTIGVMIATMTLLICRAKEKFKRKNHYIILSMWLLISCSEHTGRVVNEAFTHKESITLPVTKIKINEVLKPVDLAIFDDFLVFQNEFSKKGDWFYVYTKEMTFCFSFGQFGGGPQEFIAPRIIKNSNANLISIFDSSSYTIKEYSINKKGVSLLNEFLLDRQNYPIQEMAYVNDSIILQMAISNDGTALYSLNIVNNKRIDTAVFETGFKEKMESEYKPTIDNFRFSNKGGKFVVAPHYANDIIIGELNNDGFFTKDNYIVNNCHFQPRKEIYDNILYHIYPAISEKYIFIPFYGYPFRETAPLPVNLKGRHFDFIIEVYDWNKNPLFSILLDSEFFRLYIDQKNNKIYTWNILEDFDYLLEYNLNGL